MYDFFSKFYWCQLILRVKFLFKGHEAFASLEHPVYVRRKMICFKLNPYGALVREASLFESPYLLHLYLYGLSGASFLKYFKRVSLFFCTEVKRLCSWLVFGWVIKVTGFFQSSPSQLLSSQGGGEWWVAYYWIWGCFILKWEELCCENFQLDCI